MKRLLTKYGMMVLSLAVVIAVILSVMAYFSTSASALPNLAGIIATPFRSAGAAISETVSGWVDYFTEFDRLKEENQQLKLELAEKEAAIRQAEKDSEENERLRKLLDLREQRRDLHFESARILETDSSNWESVLTVNKGTAQDVAVGDCVVTEEGFLVGVVTEAGLNWCTIRTILDSDTSIGATVFRSGQNAVAQGDFALMGEGRLRLSYLGANPDVSSFVLPLGATINMDGTAIYMGVTSVFIASCYGIDLTIAQMATIVLTATLASIGTAGVSGAGMIMLAMVLEAIGIPVAYIGLIVAVDRLFDMGRTCLNVTGDIACSLCVTAWERKKAARLSAKK